MHVSLKVLALLLACPVGFSRHVLAKANSLGQFEGQVDIGAPQNAGGGTFDPTSGRYEVSAGGANMFGTHDEFHFVWRKLRGDFTLQARVAFGGPGATPHRKAGLMARKSLEPNAAYVDGVIHGNGPIALQLRRTDGADTEMLIADAQQGALPDMMKAGTPGADFLRLERRGNVYIFSDARYGQPYTMRRIEKIDLGEVVFVGLFLCAHNPQVVENASYGDVQVVQRTDASAKP